MAVPPWAVAKPLVEAWEAAGKLPVAGDRRNEAEMAAAAAVQACYQEFLDHELARARPLILRYFMAAERGNRDEIRRAIDVLMNLGVPRTLQLVLYAGTACMLVPLPPAEQVRAASRGSPFFLISDGEPANICYLVRLADLQPLDAWLLPGELEEYGPGPPPIAYCAPPHLPIRRGDDPDVVLNETRTARERLARIFSDSRVLTEARHNADPLTRKRQDIVESFNKAAPGARRILAEELAVVDEEERARSETTQAIHDVVEAEAKAFFVPMRAPADLYADDDAPIQPARTYYGKVDSQGRAVPPLHPAPPAAARLGGAATGPGTYTFTTTSTSTDGEEPQFEMPADLPPHLHAAVRAALAMATRIGAETLREMQADQAASLSQRRVYRPPEPRPLPPPTPQRALLPPPEPEQAPPPRAAALGPRRAPSAAEIADRLERRERKTPAAGQPRAPKPPPPSAAPVVGGMSQFLPGV